MTTKEKTKHEILEAFDFLRFLMKNPEEINHIKDGAEINILCKDIPQKASKKLFGRKRHSFQMNCLSEHIFRQLKD
jgi:hypothetical protein